MLYRITGVVLLAALVFAAPKAQAAFPGANGKIAFSSNRASDSVPDVYLSNPDGSGQVEVPNTHSDSGTANPAWSPSGSRIAFETELFQDDLYIFEINTINPDGSAKRTVLSEDFGLTGSPAWSADGAKLVYTRTAILAEGNGYRSLETINSDGSGVATVPETSQNGFRHSSPAWSPVSGAIAFDYSGCVAGSPPGVNCNSGDIFVIQPNGTRTQLTSNPASDASPNWSPDGERIAFASNRDGNYEIYVMNADGSGQARLTSNAATDDKPVWSPDGDRIAFQSNRDGNYEIYAMDADGSGQTNVTNNPSHEVDPDWQPIPFTNASKRCTAFPGGYRNHGQCVKASK